MTIPDELLGIVESYPDLEDGALYFKGTRVLVFHLISTLTIGMEPDNSLKRCPKSRTPAIFGRTKKRAWPILRPTSPSA